MNLEMKIHNIKGINDFLIELPIEQGLYAITGENGSGKSTIVSCAATCFFKFPMNSYFGQPVGSAHIHFKWGESIRKWDYNDKWTSYSSGQFLRGFYEGSVIYGNRFRDTSITAIMKYADIDPSDLIPVNPFIWRNLGKILRNDENAYVDMFTINPSACSKYKFSGGIYCYRKNGYMVYQGFMSTGENLLVTILHSLFLRQQKKSYSKRHPYLILLDEVELALHPSALRRLVFFLDDLAHKHNYVIYFSTHSLELIRDMSPSRIFYIDKHHDDSIEVINPCFPAYATKILYDSSIGYDVVIFVEDDLAKIIIDRILKNLNLYSNRLVAVLPCGGWSNTLRLADESIKSNVLSTPTKVFVILDRDVKQSSQAFIRESSIEIRTVSYLPVDSLEKYLHSKLASKKVDHELYRRLNDYLFHNKDLKAILADYRNKIRDSKDDSGKKFYNHLFQELRSLRKDRKDLIELVVDHILTKDKERMTELEEFFQANMKCA